MNGGADAPALRAQVRLQGPRVLLRPWTDADLAPFAALNADPEVMRHFPAPLDRAQSDAAAARARALFDKQGWGWWALQTPEHAFAGFVGLAWVPFELPLPGFEGRQLEVGWRLARSAWGRGDASEAARLALDFAQRVLGRPRVVSFTAWSNQRSEAVMRRIGLRPAGTFDHPRLPGHALQRHLLYAAPARD